MTEIEITSEIIPNEMKGEQRTNNSMYNSIRSSSGDAIPHGRFWSSFLFFEFIAYCSPCRDWKVNPFQPFSSFTQFLFQPFRIGKKTSSERFVRTIWRIKREETEPVNNFLGSLSSAVVFYLNREWDFKEIFGSMTKFENIVYFGWLILSEANKKINYCQDCFLWFGFLNCLKKRSYTVWFISIFSCSYTVSFISIFSCSCQAFMRNGINCQRCAKLFPHYLRHKTALNSHCVPNGDVHFRFTSAQNVGLSICNARHAKTQYTPRHKRTKSCIRPSHKNYNICITYVAFSTVSFRSWLWLVELFLGACNINAYAKTCRRAHKCKLIQFDSTWFSWCSPLTVDTWFKYRCYVMDHFQ